MGLTHGVQLCIPELDPMLFWLSPTFLEQVLHACIGSCTALVHLYMLGSSPMAPCLHIPDIASRVTVSSLLDGTENLAAGDLMIFHLILTQLPCHQIFRLVEIWPTGEGLNIPKPVDSTPKQFLINDYKRVGNNDIATL